MTHLAGSLAFGMLFIVGCCAVAMASPGLAEGPAVPVADPTMNQVVIGVLVSGGGIGAVWVAVKAVTAWVANQMASKDTIIAAKDAELSRVNTENDRLMESVRNANDLRYEAMRKECAQEQRNSRDELLAIIREGTGSHTPVPLPKESKP